MIYSTCLNLRQETKRHSKDNHTGNILGKSMRVNPIALRQAKIAYNFGLSECNRLRRNKGIEMF